MTSQFKRSRDDSTSHTACTQQYEWKLSTSFASVDSPVQLYCVFVSIRSYRIHSDHSLALVLTWNIIDAENEISDCHSIIDPRLVECFHADLDCSSSNYVSRALEEIFSKGKCSKSNHILEACSHVTSPLLHIQLDGCSLRETTTGGYVVQISHPNSNRNFNIDFQLASPNPPIPESTNFRSSVLSTLRLLSNDKNPVLHGTGIFEKSNTVYGGTMVSLHLLGNANVTLVGNESNLIIFSTTDLTAASSIVNSIIKPTQHLLSNHSFSLLPQAWSVNTETMSLTLSSLFLQQEHLCVTTFLRQVGVRVSGTWNGEHVNGVGIVECAPQPFLELKQIMKIVSLFVGKSLRDALPVDPTQDWLGDNIFGRTFRKEANAKHVADAILKPCRTLTDRPGKAWRTLLLLACMHAVSGRTCATPNRYVPLAELVHVGSLMIDDIQDNSSTRRGGPCVHLMFGKAHAINAGTACYFIAPQLARIDLLPVHQQLNFYHLYFDFLRAGHVGQGLDIEGLESYMQHAVESGDISELSSALNNVHRYKTGGYVGSLCRLACILADVSEGVGEALDNFGMSIGFAFQIIDDVLNLTGFEGDGKEVGEDIREGKITYPIVRALGKLPLEQRRYLWRTLKGKPENKESVCSVIELLKSVNALEECLQEAHVIAEDAWVAVDAVVADSFSKSLLRAFAHYLCDRKT